MRSRRKRSLFSSALRHLGDGSACRVSVGAQPPSGSTSGNVDLCGTIPDTISARSFGHRFAASGARPSGMPSVLKLASCQMPRARPRIRAKAGGRYAKGHCAARPRPRLCQGRGPLSGKPSAPKARQRGRPRAEPMAGPVQPSAPKTRLHIRQC
jgi:hypothetical protein